MSNIAGALYTVNKIAKTEMKCSRRMRSDDMVISCVIYEI